MALVVTPKAANADAYGDTPDFSTYAANVGWVISASTTVLEQHARRATQFLDREYHWIGQQQTDTQALDWPRTISEGDKDGYSVPIDVVPTDIINAQFEVMKLLLDGIDLYPTSSDPEIKSETLVAGPTQLKTDYVSGSNERPRFPSIDGLLNYWIAESEVGGGWGNMQMERG